MDNSLLGQYNTVEMRACRLEGNQLLAVAYRANFIELTLGASTIEETWVDRRNIRSESKGEKRE